MDPREHYNLNNLDLPPGWVFETTHESLLETLLLFKRNETFATQNRFEKKDVFASHPAQVIADNDIVPGLRDGTKKYYYFYCQVPQEAEETYDRNGYKFIYDKQDTGVWEKIRSSDLCHIDLSETRKVFGEINHFRYSLIDKTETSWKMKMIGLPHLKGIDRDDDDDDSEEPKAHMVICKVYEAEAVIKGKGASKNHLHTSSKIGSAMAGAESSHC